MIIYKVVFAFVKDFISNICLAEIETSLVDCSDIYLKYLDSLFNAGKNYENSLNMLRTCSRNIKAFKQVFTNILYF